MLTRLCLGAMIAVLVITFWLTLSYTLLQVLEGGSSDGRTTGDPNITRSHAVNKKIHKRDICAVSKCPEKPAQPHRITTVNPGVEVTCINPTVTRIDECLENMDKKVAETCLPGILKVLNLPDGESNIGNSGYEIQTNKSETCLRYVFSRCSYDSRFRVKTKITKHTGISLDIAFQEEFEMDGCNNETMEEVFSTIEDCLKQQSDDFKPTDDMLKKVNISTEILQQIGQCVEDHTAFPCVVKDKSLFKKFLLLLIQHFKTMGLKILDIINKVVKGKSGKGIQADKANCEKSNYTRLCFKWMDYNRLEGCEPDFYSYMIHLMNGTSASSVYGKTYGCFQDRLKVCPQDTVRVLIKILAGAVEGKSGEQSQKKEIYEIAEKPINTITLLTKNDDCSKKIIDTWIQDLKKCMVSKIPKAQETKSQIQVYGTVMAKCATEIRSTDCTVHKASQFTEISLRIIRLVIDVKPDSQVAEEDKACLKDIENTKVENCLVNLFLYFVSLNHAHYTSEARDKLLNKGKLCFQVTLKNCPFKTFIIKILETFSAAFRMKLPQLGKGEIITRVTVPEGYVWCETRIVTKDVPIPPTKRITRKVTHRDKIQTLTPTTVLKYRETVTHRHFTKKEAPPPTRIIIIEHPGKTYTKIIRPTTRREFQQTMSQHPDLRTFPAAPTTIVQRHPTRTPGVQAITPTTILWATVLPQTKAPEIVQPVPPTRFVTHIPKRTEKEEHIIPTTMRTVHWKFPTRSVTRWDRTPITKVLTGVLPKRTPCIENVIPTTIVKDQFTFPTRQYTKKVLPVIPITVPYSLPSRTEQEIEIIPTTFVWKDIDVEPPVITIIDRPMPPTKKILPPITKVSEITTIAPTIAPTFKIPRPITTEKITASGTTLKIKIIEQQPIVQTTEKSDTTKAWVSLPQRDVCELPKDHGLCKPCHDRYYYDKNTGTCQGFLFCECGGNKNNFLTLEMCQKSCVNNEGVTKGGSGSICNLPVDPGLCEPNYERWYFEVTIKKCKIFIYFGCDGNENNFHTERECNIRCGVQRITATVTERQKITVSVKEVEHSKPAPTTRIIDITKPEKTRKTFITPTTTRRQVITLKPDYIPKTLKPPVTIPKEIRPTAKVYTKRIPSTEVSLARRRPPTGIFTEGLRATTVTIEIAEIPTKIVTGSEKYQTSPLINTPKIKIYTEGRTPTTTRTTAIPVYSKTVIKDVVIPPTQEIQHRPPPKPPIISGKPKTTVLHLEVPVTEGKRQFTFPDIVKTVTLPTAVTVIQKVEPTIKKIAPQTKSFTKEILPTTLEIRLREVPGKVTQKSVMLPTTAKSVIKGVCELPVEPGYCKPYYKRYYYDKKTCKCIEFIFGDCGGNKNNFKTMEMCQKGCINKGVKKGDYGSICELPVEPGLCKPSYERWYFDQTTKACLAFIFYGCAKNGNNFHTKEECEKCCGVTHGPTPTEIIRTPPSIPEERVSLSSIIVLPPVSRPGSIYTFTPSTHQTVAATIHKVPPAVFTYPTFPMDIFTKPPLQPRSTIQTITPTTTETAKRTPPDIIWEATHRDTTIRIVVEEPTTQTRGEVVIPPITQIVTKPPRATIGTQIVPRSTTQRKRITHKPLTEWRTQKIFPTRIITRTNTPQVHTWIRPKTTTIFETYPKTRGRFSFTLTPPTTERKLWLPSRRTREELITQTTVVTRKKIPCMVTVTEMIKPTTIIKYTPKIPGIVITKEKKIPQTEVLVFTPPVGGTEYHIFPTSTLVTRIVPKTKGPTKVRPLPRTTIFEMPPTRTVKEDAITPTTSESYSHIPTRKNQFTFPPPATKRFSITPAPRTRYTGRQTPTMSSFFQHTVTRPIVTQTVRRPTTKRVTFTPRPQTRTKEAPVVTRTTEFRLSTKEYECVYPTQKPYVTCMFVPEKCTESLLQMWILKIRGCTVALLKEINKTLVDFIECVTIELKEIVLKCVRKVGDTRCRNRVFSLAEWVLETEVVVAGSLSEHVAIRPDSDEENYNMKTCVASINETMLENCFPGFYKALTDMLVYSKGEIQIEIANPQPTRCLIKGLSHCNEKITKKIEKTLASEIGKCIQLLPGGKTSCSKLVTDNQDEQEVSQETPCSKYLDVQEVKKGVNTCVCKKILKKKNISSAVILTISSDCFSEVVDQQTCIKKESAEDNKSVLQMILRFVSQYAVEDGCKKSLKGDKAKICFQNILDVLSTLDKVKKDKIVKILETLFNCLKGSVPECPEAAPFNVLSVMVLFWHNTQRMKGMLESLNIKHNKGIFQTISSIKHSDSGFEVCISEVPSMSGIEPTRPTFPDECVAINDDSAPGKTLHIVVKSCSGQDISNWLGTEKDCLEDKATKVALRDPDYLTLQSTQMILMNCIDQKGPLKCRAKHQEDFRNIFKSVFDLVRQNSLSDDNTACRNALNIENAPRCFQVLHKYLALQNEKGQSQSAKGKATSCLRNSIKSCSSTVINSLVQVLELAMITDSESVKRYFGDNVPSCSPGAVTEGTQQLADTPSFLVCGPNGKLVRNARDVSGEHQSALSLERSEYSEKNSVGLMSSKISGKEDLEQKKCDAADYEYYFDRLKECSQRRLYLRFRRMKHKCVRNDMIESWIAMTECMVENIEDELTCSVKTEKQMFDYLFYVAKSLHSNEQITQRNCPLQPRCYGDVTPKLHKCAALYLKLLKARESTDHMLQILNGTSKVLECLGSLWPNCSSEVSFMTLPFAYRPLGMNYDFTISNGLKFASCKVDESGKNNLTFPSCMNLENGSEVHLGNSINSIESCMKCVRVKDGICSLKNINDIFEVINEDFSRLSYCFKNYITNDNCLKDVTIRIRNKCVPAIYEFVKNVKKGIVLRSVEYFWNFNQCLVEFKSKCPENLRQFTPVIYYEILGLSSYFKPLLEVFHD